MILANGCVSSVGRCLRDNVVLRRRRACIVAFVEREEFVQADGVGATDVGLAGGLGKMFKIVLTTAADIIHWGVCLRPASEETVFIR